MGSEFLSPNAGKLRTSRPSTLEVLFSSLEKRCQDGAVALQEDLMRNMEAPSIQVRTVPLRAAAGGGPFKTLGNAKRREILGDAVNLFKQQNEEDIIPLRDQLSNWMEKTEFSNSVFITAAIYIDRLTAWWPEFRLTTENVSRVLAAGLVAAAKSSEANTYSIESMATVARVSAEELGDLEAKLLELIDHQCTVAEHDFTFAETELIGEAMHSRHQCSVADTILRERVFPRTAELLRMLFIERVPSDTE